MNVFLLSFMKVNMKQTKNICTRLCSVGFRALMVRASESFKTYRSFGDGYVSVTEPTEVPGIVT